MHLVKIMTFTTLFDQYKINSGTDAAILNHLGETNFPEDSPKIPTSLKTTKIEKGLKP
jgi:hypothetical protein